MNKIAYTQFIWESQSKGLFYLCLMAKSFHSNKPVDIINRILFFTSGLPIKMNIFHKGNEIASFLQEGKSLINIDEKNYVILSSFILSPKHHLLEEYEGKELVFSLQNSKTHQELTVTCQKSDALQLQYVLNQTTLSFKRYV